MSSAAEDLTPTHEVEARFLDAMREVDLEPPEPIPADGTLHRFDAPDDRRGQRTGWAVLYPPDEHGAGGAFGSWRHHLFPTRIPLQLGKGMRDTAPCPLEPAGSPPSDPVGALYLLVRGSLVETPAGPLRRVSCTGAAIASASNRALRTQSFMATPRYALPPRCSPG